MGDRIKEIRKRFGLTQQEFANRLQISRSNIATYETEKSNVGEAVIKLICREYGVDEIWLRTGEGEMLRPSSRSDEIGSFLRSVILDEDSFRNSLIAVLAKLDVDEWKLLEQMAKKLKEEMK